MALYVDINQTNPETRPLLTDVQAIFQALENIFSTITGERFFNPEFGIDLEENLFDVMDELTELEVFRKIVEAVQKFESRVIVDTATTTVISDPENNKYDIDVVFEIIGFEGQKFIYRDSITNEQVQGTAA